MLLVSAILPALPQWSKHAFPTGLLTQAEALAWSKLLVVRDGVNAALEQARSAKVRA